MIEEIEKDESIEDIQAQIAELTKKANKKEDALQEDEVDKVKIPLARLLLKIDKNGSDVTLNNVSPSEVMFLVAEHHKQAGGNPVKSLIPNTVLRKEIESRVEVEQDVLKKGRLVDSLNRLPSFVEVDPRVERNRLTRKYSQKKIIALFPGAIPQLPKTFKYAMSAGIDANLPNERLMDFALQPSNTSDSVEE